MSNVLTIPMPIKNCPWCGGKIQMTGDIVNGYNLKIKCKKCKVRMYEAIKDDDAQATIETLVKRWNERS